MVSEQVFLLIGLQGVNIGRLLNWAMESVKDMYDTMLRVSEKAYMLYEAYEKQATENEELKTLLHEEKEEKHQL